MRKETVLSGYSRVNLGVLFAITLVISLFSCFPGQVERIYSLGIYPGSAAAIRLLTGWTPFSIGDFLYLWIIILILTKAIKISILVYRKQYSRTLFCHFLFRLVKMGLWVYIIFKLLWGLNYDRSGIATQLRIANTAYSKEDVTQLTHQLIDKLNECRRQLKDTVLPEPALDTIYREAYRSYRTVSHDFPFLNYRNRSVKASLFSGLGDYMGYSGYYNPFTGEAQVRSDIPRVLIPFITCHEIAHQLGYASESEANFVGYLAAASSQDAHFRYSVYNDLFSYAQEEELMLYVKEKDSTAFDNAIQYNRTHLDSLVKKDRKEIREFFSKRRNRISPAVLFLYDQYLKLNKQIRGVDSYNEIVGWLIAYQKKYGKV